MPKTVAILRCTPLAVGCRPHPQMAGRAESSSCEKEMRCRFRPILFRAPKQIESTLCVCMARCIFAVNRFLWLQLYSLYSSKSLAAKHGHKTCHFPLARNRQIWSTYITPCAETSHAMQSSSQTCSTCRFSLRALQARRSDQDSQCR